MDTRLIERAQQGADRAAVSFDDRERDGIQFIIAWRDMVEDESFKNMDAVSGEGMMRRHVFAVDRIDRRQIETDQVNTEFTEPVGERWGQFRICVGNTRLSGQPSVFKMSRSTPVKSKPSKSLASMRSCPDR